MQNRRTQKILLTIAALALCETAYAKSAPQLKKILIVGRSSPKAPWQDGPTEARLEDHPELAVVGVAREGKKTVYLVDEEVDPLKIRGRTIPEAARRSWESLGEASFRWSHVEPYAWRPKDKVAPNGVTTRFYTNVVPSGDEIGSWLGFDEIPYFETPSSWSQEATARKRPASATPPRKEDDVYGGLGTMRYKVEVRLEGSGEIFSTPGAEAVDYLGILSSVHRVSIRKDDTYLGFLSSYFLVPELFGSAGTGKKSQAERYVGADCADVLVGALRAQGFTRVPYTHVAALPSYTKEIAGPFTLDDSGAPKEGEISGAKLGDLIRVNYGGSFAEATPRAWDHVVVWYEDKSDPEGPSSGGPDGLLDGFDLVLHMGHPRLLIEPLSGQAPATIDVLRWDEKKTGKKTPL